MLIFGITNLNLLTMKMLKRLVLPVAFFFCLNGFTPSGADPYCYPCSEVCNAATLQELIQPTVGYAAKIGNGVYIAYCSFNSPGVINSAIVCQTSDHHVKSNMPSQPFSIDQGQFTVNPVLIRSRAYSGSSVVTMKTNETRLVYASNPSPGSKQSKTPSFLMSADKSKKEVEWTLELVDAKNAAYGYYVKANDVDKGYLFYDENGKFGWDADPEKLSESDRVKFIWYVGAGRIVNGETKGYRILSATNPELCLGVNQKSKKLEVAHILKPGAHEPEEVASYTSANTHYSVFKIFPKN